MFNNILTLRMDGENQAVKSRSQIQAESVRKVKLELKKKLALKIKQASPKPVSKSFVEESSAQLKLRSKKKTISTIQDIKSMKDLQVRHQFEHYFHLGDKIGEGCHSTVHTCIEIETGKKYAVKVTKKPDEELFLSIRESYRILNKIKHESIIRPKLLLINEEIMTCHLVQQYCQMPDLYQLICAPEKLNEKQVCCILKELLKAVAFMHSQGVCHRDLKPENIMVNRQKRKIKLIDFELASMLKYTNTQFELFTKTGTLSFRAPETFKTIYDEKVDVWSCGVIAYLLLTGRMPFKSSNQAKKIRKIMEQEPDYSKVSWWEKQFLESLLKKNPKERVTAQKALSSMYFSKNFDNEERKPISAKSPMVKSPSLNSSSFQASLRKQDNQTKSAWDDSRFDDFIGGDSFDSNVMIHKNEGKENHRIFCRGDDSDSNSS